MDEIIEYYLKQGAPADQTALVSMLKEIQQECGGTIPQAAVAKTAEKCHVKESFLLAVIRRFPSLKTDSRHCLEICSGVTCGKCREIAACAEKLMKNDKIMVRYVPCMRLCGKGPNIRLDGDIYHHADAALIEKLIKPYL